MSLAMTLQTCRAASLIPAALHLLLIRTGLARPPRLLDLSISRDFGSLWECWFARCAREVLALLLRSPLRGAVLDLVRFDEAAFPRGGHIIALCHSPWGRLLSNWCHDRGNGLAFAAPGWGRHLGATHVAGGYRDLRRLVRHLRAGGRAFVVIDVFPPRSGCSVRFLGLERLASMFAVRLAAASEVPIVPAIAVFRDGRIEVVQGPPTETDSSPSSLERSLRSVLDYVDSQIRAHPAAWNDTMRGWLHP